MNRADSCSRSVRTLVSSAVLAVGVRPLLAAEPVEIVDWVSVAGISLDSDSRFEVVRSAVLPYASGIGEFYVPTATTPEGEIFADYHVEKLDNSAYFDCSWYGNVSSASGDGSSDGPFTMLAVLIRTTVPVTYEVGAFAYLGSGAGDPAHLPYAKAAIDVGFCFTPGASPVVGSEFCPINPATNLLWRDRVDPNVNEASLTLCCPATPDEGTLTGELPPGDYTLYVESGADMNLLFASGSFAEATGGISWSLAWTASCDADLNGDGFVDQGDIQTFIALFLVQDLSVDFNADGIIDQGDIQGFLATFLEGC